MNDILIGLSLFCLAGPSPTALEVEDQFLKERLALRQGTLTVHVDVMRLEPKQMSEKSVIKIWLTPEHQRFDKTTTQDGKQRRTIYCENCERDRSYVYFDSQNLDAGSNVIPLGIRRLSGGKAPDLTRKLSRNINEHLRFDPKIIGVATWAFDAYPVKSLVARMGRTDRDKPTLEKIRWGDWDAFLISYTLKSGSIVKDVYVPDLGNSIVSSEVTAISKDKKKHVQRMEAELSANGTSRVWFPAKVSIRHFVDDRQIYTALMEIKDFNFTELIAPTVFKLIGMEIPRKTEIDLRPETPGSHYWNGEMIVREVSPELDTDLPSPQGGGGSGFWWFGTSIVLAIFSLIAIGWYFVRAWKSRR